MRPLSMTIRGIRSYMRPCTVDFSGVGLMAVVGDTGAGKSTLLEALTFALYGGSTWNKSGSSDLVSQHAQQLRVDLTFAAAGQEWKVTRAVSPTSYPPAMHNLVCLSDETSRWDKKRDVDQQIVRLVGLGRDAFLRTVLLPQGRFQELLQATAAERTEILKGVFGLAILDKVHQEADALLDNWRPLLTAMRARREVLLPDPAAAAAQARTEQDARQAELEKLREQREEYRTAIAAAEAARQEEALLPAPMDIDPVACRAVLTRLQSLTTLYETGLGEWRPLAARAKKTQEELAEWKERLAVLQAQGQDLGSLASCRQRLLGLRDGWELLQQEETAAAMQAVERTQSTRRLVEKEKAATALQQAAREEHALWEHAKVGAQAAAHQYDTVAAALETARAEAQTLASLAQDIAACAKELSSQSDQAEQAKKTAADAQATQVQARTSLEEIQRHNAGAHAAETVSSGDPCPVCRRSLPDTWFPPVGEGTTEATKALRTAENKARRTAKEETAAIAALASLEVRYEDMQERHATIAASCKKQREDLATVLGLPAPLHDVTSLETSLLRGLLATRSEREKAAALLKNTYGHKAEEAEAARRVCTAAQAALDAQEKEHAIQAERRTQRSARLAVTWEEIPDPFRPLSPTLAAIPPALEQIEKAEMATQHTVQARDRCHDVLPALRTEMEEITDRLHSEVEIPRDMLARELATLRANACRAGQVVGSAEPPPAPAQAALAALLEYSDALVVYLEELRETLAGQGERVREKIVEQEEKSLRILAAAHVDGVAALEEQVAEASTAIRMAARITTEATEQIEQVNSLDEAIAAVSQFVETMQEVRSHLTKGRFLAYVVAQRQRTLLAVASSVLASMSQDRFGFAADFSIVDRESGQARSVRTLSGGETFLASLALALAMVEIAARTGDRLGALFLDEGFGSLDAGTLDQALGELERRAEAGALIGVISHVRAVAERFEHVLLVRRDVNGSDAQWLDGQDQEGMSEGTFVFGEEIDGGLLV